MKYCRLSILLGYVLVWSASPAAAQISVTIAWDPNPEPFVTGYWVSWGTTAGFTHGADAGNRTEWTITGLDPAVQHMFTVQAYTADRVYSDPAPAITYGPVTLPPPTQSAALHDLNGDGRSDLLWQHDRDGWVAAWFMDGNAVLGYTFLSPSVVNPNWKVAGTGDLNGDGAADVVWREQQGSLAVWFMQGHIATAVRMLSIPREADLNWRIRAVGDVNGDRKADVIWQHETTNAVRVWLMDGETVLSSMPISTVGPGWTMMGAGDINRDGKADIIWQNVATTSLATWFLNGNVVIGLGYKSTVKAAGSDWIIGGVGDLNGDGCADLVWQNSNTGALFIWYLDGWNVIAYGVPSLQGNPDTGWKLRGPG